MCLGIPAKVIERDEALQGKVEYLGTQVRTSFALLPEVRIGDWVILHAGYAIARLDEKEAQETLNMLREIAEWGRAVQPGNHEI